LSLFTSSSSSSSCFKCHNILQTQIGLELRITYRNSANQNEAALPWLNFDPWFAILIQSESAIRSVTTGFRFLRTFITVFVVPFSISLLYQLLLNFFHIFIFPYIFSFSSFILFLSTNSFMIASWFFSVLPSSSNSSCSFIISFLFLTSSII